MRMSIVLLTLLVGACKGDSGDICEKSSDCASDLCLGRGGVSIKQCYETCDGQPCREGEVCLGSTYCVVPCSTEAPSCPDGLVCYTGTGECLPVCESNDDCYGSPCVDGLCM